MFLWANILNIYIHVESTATFECLRRTMRIACFVRRRFTATVSRMNPTELEAPPTQWVGKDSWSRRGAFSRICPCLEVRSRAFLVPLDRAVRCLWPFQNLCVFVFRDPLENQRLLTYGRDVKAVYSRLPLRQVFPREDLGVFPLPRNSLGKGFRELGWRPWTLESATSLSQGTMWPIPKTHRNLGQRWLFKLEVRRRPKCLHPPRKMPEFQNPP